MEGKKLNKLYKMWTWFLEDVLDKTLTEYNVPAEIDHFEVQQILAYAFQDCVNMKKITLPDTLCAINNNAFENCRSLTEISIPAGVEMIFPNAFKGCSNLSVIRVDQNNQTFFEKNNCLMNTSGDLLFGCNGEIPDGVKKICSGSFCGDRIREVMLPDTVTAVEAEAFADCPSLQYHSFGNGLYLGTKDNPYHVLMGTATKEVKTCEIHPDTKVIAEDAFADCRELEKLNIPVGTTYIGQGFTAGCHALNCMTVEENHPIYMSENNCIIAKDTQTLFAGCHNSVIPEGVKIIGYQSFADCGTLKTLPVPDGVEKIGSGAFLNCESLESVTLPATLKSLNLSAFGGCKNLKKIYYRGTKQQWGEIEIRRFCDVNIEDMLEFAQS